MPYRHRPGLTPGSSSAELPKLVTLAETVEALQEMEVVRPTLPWSVVGRTKMPSKRLDRSAGSSP